MLLVLKDGLDWKLQNVLGIGLLGFGLSLFHSFYSLLGLDIGWSSQRFVSKERLVRIRQVFRLGPGRRFLDADLKRSDYISFILEEQDSYFSAWFGGTLDAATMKVAEMSLFPTFADLTQFVRRRTVG